MFDRERLLKDLDIDVLDDLTNVELVELVRIRLRQSCADRVLEYRVIGDDYVMWPKPGQVTHIDADYSPKWTSALKGDIPVGPALVTIGWQHYSGMTTVLLGWYDGMNWFGMEAVRHIRPRPCASMESNSNATVTHYIPLVTPEAAAPFVLSDGTMFQKKPTKAQLKEH